MVCSLRGCHDGFLRMTTTILSQKVRREMESD